MHLIWSSGKQEDEAGNNQMIWAVAERCPSILASTAAFTTWDKSVSAGQARLDQAMAGCGRNVAIRELVRTDPGTLFQSVLNLAWSSKSGM
jgi:hypothetical protein